MQETEIFDMQSADQRATVRAVALDKFAGLKAHDYIKARNLSPPVQRVQTSAHAELGQAKETCK